MVELAKAHHQRCLKQIEFPVHTGIEARTATLNLVSQFGIYENHSSNLLVCLTLLTLSPMDKVELTGLLFPHHRLIAKTAQ